MTFVENLMTRPGRRFSLFMTGIALIFAAVAFPNLALAAATAPSLGSAQSFAILGGSAVTNTGATVVTGDLGLSPGSAISGFPPGIVTGGAMHKADAVALQAQSDVTTAYNNLAGQACNGNETGKDLGGLTLTSGVYCFSSSAQLTGMLTLDAQGNANSVFIIQVGTTLTTAANSSVRVVNGGTNCNVFWQIGSSATLGTGTAFVGSILALTSITLTTGANVTGRALARNGAVTLDTNTISAGGCGTPTATATATGAATATATGTATATATGAASATATGAASATAVAGSPPASCVGNIRGSKQDGAGHGLAGWTIQLLQGGQVVQTAVTDASGNFNFLGLGMGPYTVQEVKQTGWVAQAPTAITVSLSSCNQNLTGNTFVNVLGTGALTPAATALPATLTAIAKGTTTGTPTSGGAGLTPSAVGTSVIPTSLPNTGDSTPWGGAFALLVGASLLAVGFVVRRTRGG